MTIRTDWTERDTDRFAALRLKALDSTLTPVEQQELVSLQARFEVNEAQQLENGMTAMRHAHRELASTLAAVEDGNQQLVLLLQQHEQLIEDVQTWMADFHERREAIAKRHSALKASGMLAE
jgi:hypothetical protein